MLTSEWHSLLNSARPRTDGVIFVLDMFNAESVFWDTAQRHLDMLLDESFASDAAILLLANKQDLPNAVDVGTISHELALHALRNRRWAIQPCSASRPDDDGIEAGLSWLLETLKPHTSAASERKFILFVSGFVRDIASKHRLLSAIPVEIVKFIHFLVRDPAFDCDAHPFLANSSQAMHETNLPGLNRCC